jgi:hypothetical protein
MIPRPVSVWMRLDGSPQGLPLSRGDGGLPDGPGRARMEPLEPRVLRTGSQPGNGRGKMSNSLQEWSHRDLRFVIATLLPERGDPEEVADLLQDDESLLEAMLGDDRLFEQMMADEEVFVSVSPEFFFRVLLYRARRDLEQEVYTVERRHLQKVVLFDANRVVELLARPGVCGYLASMLASFTRINSVTIPIRVRPGVWRRMRVNDLDVDSLVRYAQILEEEQRYGVYKRIADACLFLTGIFPEYIEARQRYPQSGQPRLRLKSSLLHDLEDHEKYGRTFYRLAARHGMARLQGLDEILSRLSANFILAEKPLALLAERYLSLRKRHLFEL